LHTAFDNPNLIYVPQSQNELKKVAKFLATAKSQVTKNLIKFKKTRTRKLSQQVMKTVKTI